MPIIENLNITKYKPNNKVKMSNDNYIDIKRKLDRDLEYQMYLKEEVQYELIKLLNPY